MDETENPAPKRRGGRPSQGKRGTFSFRVTDTLREKLEVESRLHKMPVSEIIERRLADSYAREDAVGGPQNRALADAVVATALIEEARVGRPWHASDDDARFTLARISYMLSRLMDVKALYEVSDAQQRYDYSVIDVVAENVDKQYAEPNGLGGSVYTSIREKKRVRDLQHRLSNLEYLQIVSRQKREIALEADKSFLKKIIVDDEAT